MPATHSGTLLGTAKTKAAIETVTANASTSVAMSVRGDCARLSSRTSKANLGGGEG